ncbi:flavin reductase family protein [Acidipropionibacterium timonense]|uniref:flavin reductase family protein n=1 Tax=Acidipropionibacterium timonense TaxID=2161818 RepID=UPI00102FA6F5|nr:flavin reductase [Acidipropionibacterium timonense]
MTIHDTDPFADPVDRPGRRLRGRLGGRVTIWTSGTLGDDAAGLTISSMMVAAGEPWSILGLVNPDSDLADAVAATGRVSVNLLCGPDENLADTFSGELPALGGPFSRGDWADSDFGPRLVGRTWAGATVESVRRIGWMDEVLARIDAVEVGDDVGPLHHVRGHYEVR